MDKLCAIVVHFQGVHQIRRCVESLCSSVVIPDRIVIVDNGGFDDLGEFAGACGGRIELVPFTRNCGYAAAINMGAQRSRCETLLILNPDVVLEPDAIGTAIAHLAAHPEVGVLGPRVLYPDGSVQESARAFPRWSTLFVHRHAALTRHFPGNPLSRAYLRPLEAGGNGGIDWVSGCCMFIRREALDRVGGMDEGYFLFMEDVDLCWRIRLEGTFHVRYFPEAVVTHDIGVSNQRYDPGIIRHRHHSIRLFIDRFYRHLPAPLRRLGRLVITIREKLHLARARFVRRSGEKSPGYAASSEGEA